MTPRQKAAGFPLTRRPIERQQLRATANVISWRSATRSPTRAHMGVDTSNHGSLAARNADSRISGAEAPW